MRFFGTLVSRYANSYKWEKNISIDSHKATKFHDGESVAAALFKQRYFENTLGWDFDNIWYWDDKEDRPALRSVGVGSAPKAAAQPANGPTTDLLTQQIRANLWL